MKQKAEGTHPHGEPVGWDAATWYPVFRMSELVKKACLTLHQRVPRCCHRGESEVKDGELVYPDDCEKPATHWMTVDDYLEGMIFYFCEDHLDLDPSPYNGCCWKPPAYRDPPRVRDTYRRRFGKQYQGSMVPWLRERGNTGKPKWRRIPKTVYAAYAYLYGGGPWCCDADAPYWLGKDRFAHEDRWDYACENCAE